MESGPGLAFSPPTKKVEGSSKNLQILREIPKTCRFWRSGTVQDPQPSCVWGTGELIGLRCEREWLSVDPLLWDLLWDLLWAQLSSFQVQPQVVHWAGTCRPGAPSRRSTVVSLKPSSLALLDVWAICWETNLLPGCSAEDRPQSLMLPAAFSTVETWCCWEGHELFLVG